MNAFIFNQGLNPLKLVYITLFLAFSVHLQAQEAYNWINRPHDAGDNSEYDMAMYTTLHGPIKKIDDGELTVYYNKSGKITSIHNYRFVSEGERPEIYQYDEFGPVVLPEKYILDENGNMTYLENFGDKTFSKFDEYGRKILDSVPSSGHTGMHTNRYFYNPTSVLKLNKGTLGNRELDITIYTVDHYGNWIKKEEVFYSMEDHHVITTRRIEYYE